MVDNTLTNELIYAADPEMLNDLLNKKFVIPMLDKVETIEDMQVASEMMGRIVGYLQFLTPVYTILEIRTQNYKDSGEKTEYKLMMQRRNVVKSVCDTLNKQRETLSRMVTIKQEINKEISMF